MKSTNDVGQDNNHQVPGPQSGQVNPAKNNQTPGKPFDQKKVMPFQKSQKPPQINARQKTPTFTRSFGGHQ